VGSVRTVLALVFMALMAQGVRAGPEDATAQNLLENWKDADPATAAFAEVIASAFASGFSWGGHLGGTEVYCPAPDLGGREIMRAFEKFLKANPDMAVKPYGAAMAASLHQAFPCQAL
jgi:Rap1a immunity proteins